MKQRICFRADASASIGYGHFIRTLALADMLKDDFDCVFFTTDPSPYQIDELDKVCRFITLHEESKLDDFLSCLEGTEIVVLDNYFFTTDYQHQIKAKGCKLVCVDDMHDKHYSADLVINHGVTDPNLFSVESYTKLCLGFDYVLLRAPFLKPIQPYIRNRDLVVSFGGADPFGITDRIVTMLLKMDVQYRVTVILGDKVHLSEENRKRVVIKKNLSAEEMARLFEQSAAGILSASTVCLEALSRELPIIVGFHVDNQLDFYNSIKQNRLAILIDRLQDVNSKRLQTAIHQIGTFQSKSLSFQQTATRFVDLFRALC